MATRRKTYKFRDGDIIDVIEFHDANYGAPGMNRSKRKKPTEEQIRVINAMNKARRVRQRLLMYFNFGDCFATWTYTVENRPPDMKAALKDFQKAMRYVRKEYKKRGQVLRWFRNIERGTKGKWHIHLIVNEIGDTVSILEKAWEKGGTWASAIRKNTKVYDEDFTKLANYITKDEHTKEEKKDGTLAKPKIKEANFNSSRNMPLPEPKQTVLVRWKKNAKPKKGYYIVRIHEGENLLGFRYRRYTMVRLNRRI